jgi:hypothetical protein
MSIETFLFNIAEPLTYLLWILTINACLPMIAILAGTLSGILGIKK